MITKEWPPKIYGGAGVHVTNLVSALNQLPEISSQVHCFGETRNDAHAYPITGELTQLNPALQALLIDSDIAMGQSTPIAEANVVHSHTWYANFAGYLAAKSYGIAHVATAHSLEPLRPWKAEQLGGGYQISSWVERLAFENASAIIAVSDGMRSDVLKAYPSVDPTKVFTIRNGINTEKFVPNNDAKVIEKYGIHSKYAMFVGRITRQKGLAHVLRAWQSVNPDFTLVLAASSPDEPAIGQEVEALIAELSEARGNIIWIKEMLPHHELTALLTQAQAFLCPSIYEPLGIVNLEAMACETAVVASNVGGIPEVVADGKTGVLVEYTKDAPEFEKRLAKAINDVMSNTELAVSMGKAGRKRAVEEFGWDKVAQQTIDLYRSVIK
ncbi:MAG: glycogen synthase [Candidatus Nanopelagicaceae bacterium]|nr:glycogen synthase [Candidatus Nanopelagicaceae bacterium]